MSITPRAQVPGPIRQPLPYGLSSVVAILEDTSARWEGGGVEHEQLGCPPAARLIGGASCDDTAGLPKSFDPGAGRVEADPFYVYGSYVCSPIGNPVSHAEAVARDRLAVYEDSQVETRLWSGSPEAGALPAPFTAATPVDLGTDDLAVIVPAVEQAISDGYGSLGIIHMSRENALRGIEAGVLEAKGGKLSTKLGTPVVAGSGYDSDLVVGTPWMIGYRSPVFTSSNRAGDLLDRSENDLHAVAERAYVVTYDDCGPWTFTVSPSAPPEPIPGPAGASAYEVAVSEGFEGDEVAWLASLQGPPGDPGDPGSPGVVQSLVAGDGIAVDPTDPANPIISTS